MRFADALLCFIIDLMALFRRLAVIAQDRSAGAGIIAEGTQKRRYFSFVGNVNVYNVQIARA